MEVERLAKVGAQSLSLSGEELRKWIDETLEKDREEKEAEIERKKETNRLLNEEIHIRRPQREAGREAREAQREADREAADQKMLILEKEAELLRLRNAVPSNGEPSPRSEDRLGGAKAAAGQAKAPKLPDFKEGRDDMESCLLRFERFASANCWPRENWAVHISALQSGKALDTFSRLSEDESTDYDVVKRALLKRYNLTSEGFNLKFRSSRSELGERMSQFKTRLESYLDRWMELSERDLGSSEHWKDLMLYEQLNSCGRDLRTFLMERKPRSCSELIVLAEQYIEAHGESKHFSKSTYISAKMPEKAKADDFNRPQCHICGKSGHRSKDSFKRGTPKNPQQPLKCDVCKKVGHVKENCWSRQKPAASVVLTKETDDFYKIQMSATCSSSCDVTGMPVAEGQVNGKKCTVLRDSGCSSVIVRRGLVGSTVPLTGTQRVCFADGSVKRVPTAMIYVDCPYYKGSVEAALLDKPLFDLILGNIEGAKCPGTRVGGSLEAAAMETRAACRREWKKLKTPKENDLGLSVEELKALQKEDPSLEQARKNAETGDIVHTGRANECRCAYQKGVLMRHFKSPLVEHGDVVKQVVVSTCLRHKVMTLAHDSILAGHLAAKKTSEKILTNFYWPNLWGDVARFCQSCDTCQRSAPKGRTSKVPLDQMPIIDQPFSWVAVDLIGPILPSSERGYRYVLAIVDFSTRYPEAVPLKSVSTEAVAEALVEIFSRVGLPNKILSDCGCAVYIRPYERGMSASLH